MNTVFHVPKPEPDAPYALVALVFAQALAEGAFEKAHSMLSSSMRKELSQRALQKAYEEMISYGDGPANHVEVMTTMTEWPDRIPHDAGWVYVSIMGPGYSEAVTVVVTREEKLMTIRSLDWGRP